MTEIRPTAGTTDYRDTGGDGPAIVLLHGLLMDASLWDDTIAELAPRHRRIAPTLPLGALPAPWIRAPTSRFPASRCWSPNCARTPAPTPHQ
jgi:pimeloyl-ACP methyl ester carboxylesterase